MATMTRIREYKSEGEMNRDIKRWEKAGWTVLSIVMVDQGYSGIKSCLLGFIFLPLALLGKKRQKYQVTYQGYKAD